ncbi:tyrosine-type recombinase/integrase [Candidatus Methylopumilus turicensis]|uniref:Integrase family protein n=1 Tax=Candidatus Methylopumilus turicensis TaxID=1581680 RepID=A0A0B7IUK5_9PROT|nr:tyrosine-type recombinase/integrase [Candidatus Methylopumilus turicensis]CEN55990.1 Integrase family protein [Candidatus Methylopumilus turicensis]
MANHTSNEILKETIKRIDGAYAPATIRAYKSNFERFIEFCEQEKIVALPANQETVARYIRDLSNGKLKSASIRIAVASISAIHRLNEHSDPTSHPNVKIEVRRMHRNLGRESKQALGINAELLRKMLSTTDNSLWGLRDKALLLTAYDSMCRRSELVSLQIDDAIIDKENKTFKIKLRRSKTDQDGIGRWLHLSDMTQQSLLVWIDTSNIATGKLFRGIKRGQIISDDLSSAQVNRIYKSIVARSCVDGSLVKHISGHSMRVGAAQDLLVSGASLPMIMQRGRWSKVDTVMRYIENVSYS